MHILVLDLYEEINLHSFQVYEFAERPRNLPLNHIAFQSSIQSNKTMYKMHQDINKHKEYPKGFCNIFFILGFFVLIKLPDSPFSIKINK